MTADWETSSTLQGKANRLKGKGAERGREGGGDGEAEEVVLQEPGRRQCWAKLRLDTAAAQGRPEA